MIDTFPNLSNSGKISLTIPSDLTVVSTGWTATIGSSNMDCALAGSVVTATHSLTSSVAGMQIIITFSQITNPSSTKPTNSFVIYSQESSSGTYYNIDGVTSGLTYAATTLGTLSSVTVTRDTINTSNDGLKTGRATNFLFSFIISNDLTTDSTFTFIMPTESDAKIISTATSFDCSATDWSTGATVTWTVTASTKTVLITDYWSSSSGRSCTASSTIKIWLKKTFMQNMGWIKSPLASTDSFTIKSGLAGGLYFIDGVSSSIVATPSLIQDAIQFISPEISRSSNTINAKVEWTYTIKFTSNSLTSTDYVYLTIPDDVVYDMGETLTIILTSNSSASVPNTKVLYSSGAIKTITMTSICGTSGWATNSFLTFKISWFKNPPALTTITSAIKLDSATSSGWLIDQAVSSTVDKMFSALTVVPITNINITPSNPSAGAATNYNVIFTADTSIPQNSYIIITIPSELSVSSTNTGGSTSLNTWLNLFDSTVTIAWTVTTSSGTTKIKVTGVFPNTSNSGQYGVTIGLLQNPSAAGTTSSFKVDIYSPAGNSVASKEIDTPVNILSPVSSWTSPCATCAGTSTTWASCTNPSDMPFLQGNSCVDSCGGGYFLSGTSWYACHASWATWSGYKDSNCLTCNSGYYFQNGYWVTECGKNTVVSNGQWVSTSDNGSWSSTCATWSKTLTWCLSWPSTSSTPIVNPVDGTWVSSNYASWNTGYYVDTTTKSWQKCSTRWKDWNFSSTSWFSCWSYFTSNKLDMVTYKWVSTWSTNTYYDSSANSCPAWNAVCLTCTSSSPSTCTSWNKTEGGLQLYLTDNQWVINWPKPYSKNTSNNKWECRRQAYISLVNPSPSCLHKSRVWARAYTVGKGERGTARTRKFTVYPPTSYFGIGRGPEGYPQSPKTFKVPSPLPHNSDSILNPLIP